MLTNSVCNALFSSRDVGGASDSAIDVALDNFLWFDTLLWVDPFRIDFSATMDLVAFIFAVVCISNYVVWRIRYKRLKRLDDARIRKVFA